MQFFLGVAASLVASVLFFLFVRFVGNIIKRGKIFVSVPMEGFLNNDDYKGAHEFSEKLSLKVQAQGKEIYCASCDINEPSKFESPVTGASEVFERIAQSKYFVLVLGKRVATGSLVELGFALAKNRRIVIFFKEGEDPETKTLPWLIRGIDSLPKSKRAIRKIQFETYEEVISEFEEGRLPNLLNF